MMQGLETERDAEGEGDTGGLRAAGGGRKERENNNNVIYRQHWIWFHSRGVGGGDGDCFGDSHEIQTGTPQTTNTVLAAAMNKIWAIINAGVVSTYEQMLRV